MSRKTYTVTEIAEALGATWHQVHQAILKLELEPSEHRAGVRMFDSDAKRRIGQWVQKNARRKLSKV